MVVYGGIPLKQQCEMMLIYFNGEDYDKAANLEAFPPKNQINTYMI
jgi:hypothetical protein